MLTDCKEEEIQGSGTLYIQESPPPPPGRFSPPHSSPCEEVSLCVFFIDIWGGGGDFRKDLLNPYILFYR